MEEQLFVSRAERGITIGDIMSAVFCKKLLMVIITLIITLIGTLGIIFIYDGSKQEYVARFDTNAINFKEGTYIDGSTFDYREIISLAGLKEVIASDEKFSKLDANDLLETGAISINIVSEYDENLLNVENKIVETGKYYEIRIKKSKIGKASIARSFVKALIERVVNADVEKTDSMDYTSNFVSYDTTTRYDAQIECLQKQYNFIVDGYNALVSSYGNVMVSGKNLKNYRETVHAYSSDYTFARLTSELEQYGYVKDYAKNGRVYYTKVIQDVNEYKVSKLKLEQLTAQRDETLDKYSSMGGVIENTGLDALYVQMADLVTEIEDIKQDIVINLRRLATHYSQADLESDFSEALTIIGASDASSIYTEVAKGDVDSFNAYLESTKETLIAFTDEYKQITKDIVTTCSTVFYKESSVVKLTGGIGTMKAVIISLAAGFILACIVNLILGREKLSLEYRLKKAVDLKKKYGGVQTQTQKIELAKEMQ